MWPSRLGHCWVILSQSKSRTHKTLDNTHSQTTLTYTLVITHKTHTPTRNNLQTQKRILIDPTYKTYGNKNIHNLIRELKQIEN